MVVVVVVLVLVVLVLVVLVLVLVVVAAFSSRARIFGECSTNHSPPALFFLNGD